MTQSQDIRLILNIQNKQPIELFDLTKSLIALASQFESYVDKNADSKENRAAKLYVKEIKSGSVILELIELATIGMLPFLENMNTVLGFATYCKKVIDFFLKNEGEKPELTPADFRDFSSIINPIAKDNGSQFNVSTTVNGDVHQYFVLNSTESNALQNKFKGEIDLLRTPEQLDDIHSSVLMTWFQAKNDIKSKTGNMAVIEEISHKALKITFENEELKETILHGDLNPFNMVYVVDVKIQTVNDEPKAYKIVKLHDTFDVNEPT